MTSKHPKRCPYLLVGGMSVMCRDSFSPSRCMCDHQVCPDCWGVASHSSASEPAEWSLEEIVSGIQGAFDRGVIAGKKAAREEVLELLSDLKGYADGEYEESNLSDNEHEMRIHLEYTNRIWGIMRSLRGGAP